MTNVSMPWRAFGGSDRGAGAGDAKQHVSVSMPWRAFGGSDPTGEPVISPHVFRFNALAGVRGFGPGLSARRYHGPFMVSMPWRAFGGSDLTERQRRAREEHAFQCPGGRSGVRTPGWRSRWALVVAFQCPGGRSGVRTNRWPMICARGTPRFQCPGGRSGVRTRAFRRSARNSYRFQCPGGRSGVRTDGQHASRIPSSTAVSMPWRAFGGSDGSA